MLFFSIDMYDDEGFCDGGGCMWLFIGVFFVLSGVSDLCIELCVCDCIVVVEGSIVIGVRIELVFGGIKVGVCIDFECSECGGEYGCVCCVFVGFLWIFWEGVWFC